MEHGLGWFEELYISHSSEIHQKRCFVSGMHSSKVHPMASRRLGVSASRRLGVSASRRPGSSEV